MHYNHSGIFINDFHKHTHTHTDPKNHPSFVLTVAHLGHIQRKTSHKGEAFDVD